MTANCSNVGKDHPHLVAREGELQNAWGYRFRWTSDHQTREQYRQLKITYDELAEDCLQALESRFGLGQTKELDAYGLLERHHEQDAKLSQMWNEVTATPSWVDWNQIARGQDVYYRYGLAIMTGLAYQSLIGGTGGSGDISETLSKTGAFSISTARKRLLETSQFVLQITESLPSIKPGGAGFAAALRVRFLHAKVRRRITQLASTRPSYYSVEKCGVPINDADCIATIAAFSSTLIWQSLPRQGIHMREQEILDYLALWRLVAIYMGTPSDCLSSPERAKASMETILLHEFEPTATSKLLVRNMIRALENQPPLYASRALIEANIWWLNGAELSRAFGINRPSPYYYALVAGQCILFASFSYINRSIHTVDRWQIETFRRELWSVVMDAKHSGLGRLSVFDFKYIPGLRTSTRDGGDVVEKRATVFWTADRKALVMLLIPLITTLGCLWLLLRTVASKIM